MKRPLILAAALTLAACGAGGAPERPKTGVTLTGEASVGVVGTN